FAVGKRKEPAYFTDFSTRNWVGPGGAALQASTIGNRADYDGLFADQSDRAWRLDASTDYLSCPVSAERIAAFRDDPEVGQVRVAMILRDPVARAISEYQHTIRDRMETGSLRHAIEREDARLAKGKHPLFGHVFRGSYASQIARYRAHFDDILILDYHGMSKGFSVVNQMTAWLGLPSVEAKTMAASNKSHVYRSSLLHRFAENTAIKNLTRPFVPSRLRDRIRQVINAVNQTSYSPSTVELEMLRDALADEISACVDDPTIPTDNWTLALNR
ncbi:MAG: hypothetical protein P8L32_06990, partial [Paracoccaceae bacterium]|nr:hypothetical protein [Paracoccaceae bacterium]